MLKFSYCILNMLLLCRDPFCTLVEIIKVVFYLIAVTFIEFLCKLLNLRNYFNVFFSMQYVINHFVENDLL